MKSHSFFNPSNKDSYLAVLRDSNLSYLDQAYHAFVQSAQYEMKFGRDLALFKFGHFKEMFEDMDWTSHRYIELQKLIFRTYLRWYKMNLLESYEQIDIHNSIDQISVRSVDATRTFEARWFSNYEELAKIIYSIHSQIDFQKSRYDTPICLLLVAFFGFKLEEALAIKKEHVIADESKIKLGEGYIEIDASAMQIIQDYNTSDGFDSEKLGKPYFYQYENSPFLFRGARSATIEPSNARRYISDMNSFIKDECGLDKTVSYKKTYWSGIYYRAFQYELSTNITLKPTMLELCEQLFREKYNSIPKLSNRLMSFESYKKQL